MSAEASLILCDEAAARSLARAGVTKRAVTMAACCVSGDGAGSGIVSGPVQA